MEGEKADKLREKGIDTSDIILGVRPEHIKLTNKNNPAAIPCKIQVNEMMGSELHLHVVEPSGSRLIARVPTVSLDEDTRRALVYGTKIYITFESKVMHFFDPATQNNLLV